MISENFSVEGFFEDFSEQDTARYLGKRAIEWPDRPLGSEGRVDRTLTETIVLTKNTKSVAYKASKSSPLKVRALIYPLCGKMLKLGDAVRVRRTKEEQIRSLAPKEGIIRTFDAGVPGLIGLRAGKVEWLEDYWRVSLVDAANGH